MINTIDIESLKQAFIAQALSESDQLSHLRRMIHNCSPQQVQEHQREIQELKQNLRRWAGELSLSPEILISGSQAKDTQISPGSDVDYLVSLAPYSSTKHGGLDGIYDYFYEKLCTFYGQKNVRKQNVSIGITITPITNNPFLKPDPLRIDVTPAQRHPGNSSDHSIYSTKRKTWTKTNPPRHISDIRGSGRTLEIKLLKIFRKIYRLDFFISIYLEYLVLQILEHRPKDANSLAQNCYHILSELSKTALNPLDALLKDPANGENHLSDELTSAEKKQIKKAATCAIETLSKAATWASIFPL